MSTSSNRINFKFVKHLITAAIAREIMETENLPHKIALNEARIRPRKCALSSCDKKPTTMGYCSSHYQKFRVHGDPSAGKTRLPKQYGKCSFEGCDKPKKSLNLCATHYLRVYKNGTLGLKITKRTGRCSFEGCKKPDYTRGYCISHYRSLMASGELKVIQPKKKRSK